MGCSMIIKDAYSKNFASQSGRLRKYFYRIPCYKFYNKNDNNNLYYLDINKEVFKSYQAVYNKHLYPEFLVKYSKSCKEVMIKNYYTSSREPNYGSWNNSLEEYLYDS